MRNHCKRCKIPIEEEVKTPASQRGYCEECDQIAFKEKVDKIMAAKIAKTHNTVEWGAMTVKSQADPQFWCSTHEGCFRCSFGRKEDGRGETDDHRDTKYERWKFHKKCGRLVWCELRLRNGMGRPDLVVVDKGFTFIEEIVCSEKEASIVLKKDKYPWPISVVYTKNFKKEGIKDGK
jgi:hypothetical protein